MITRSAKRRSMHFECDSLSQVSGNEIQIQPQNSISVETPGHIPLGNEQLQKSIFNIHIHSSVDEISTLKRSMPGAHPLFQVCPKVLKTLECNILNESRKLTPILGNMELSFQSNSAERNCLKLENNRSSQRCWTDIKNDSSGNSKCGYNNMKSMTDTSFKNNNSKTFKNTKEISSYAVDLHSIKLKKAIVVLTDIFKSKHKAPLTDHAAKDQVDTNGIGNKKDFSSVKVKQENLNNNTGIIDSWCTNTTDTTFSTRPSLDSVKSTSLSGSRLLTQLAEGCSFSEILNRFRIKNGNCLVHTLNYADAVNQGNFNTVSNSSKQNLEAHNDQPLKSERFSFGEDENTVEGFLTTEFTETIESEDFKDSNLLDLPQCSEYEESREDDENLRNQSLDSHMVSDCNKNTTAVHSVSEDITADSSCVTSDVESDRQNVTISEEISSVPETSSNLISIVSNSNLNLHESEQPNSEVDKKIMKSKKFLGINKSKGKKKKRSRNMTPQPHNSPLLKKMKRSNQKSDTSQEKTNLPNEYIPLQASGPTKFGVALLNQIKPYVQHDAKDFRHKMLFGDRNKRVSSSQHLRIYKLKQKVNRSKRERRKGSYKWD